jgi:cell division septal protein FtsQ
MNLADQIRIAIIASQPEGSNLSSEDIKVMTNMILSTLSRNKLIKQTDAIGMQLPIKNRAIRLEYYEKMWKMLKKVDPTCWTAQIVNNRDDGEE